MSDEFASPLEKMIAGGAALDEEWRAATGACAVFPAAHRTLARATGEDRASFLQGMLTNDVGRLAPGTGMPAAFLTDSGKVVSDLRLYCEEDSFVVDCLSWRFEHLRAVLDKYIIADDVEIEIDEERVPLACLEGPECGVVAERAVAAPLQMEPFAAAAGRCGDRAVVVYAVSDAGGDGRLIAGPPAARQPLLEACVAAGAVTAGLATLNVLRVEAGIAWPGIDMGEDTLLMEIGMVEAISRTKGCYLGQEVVERVSARGQVNRTLTAFTIDAPPDCLPAGRLEVRADDTAVGSITSRVFSPALGATLGMGLLHRKGRDAADSLHVVGGEGRDERVACRVAEFPRARS